MMTDLSDMIVEQGEMLDRIEDNIDCAGEHIINANDELAGTKKSKSNRCFICIISLLLLIIVIAAILLTIKLKVKSY